MAAEPAGWVGAVETGEEEAEGLGLGAAVVTDGDTPASLPALAEPDGLAFPARKATAPTAISTTSAATPISRPRRPPPRRWDRAARGGSGPATSPPRHGSGCGGGHCRPPPVGWPWKSEGDSVGPSCRAPLRDGGGGAARCVGGYTGSGTTPGVPFGPRRAAPGMADFLVVFSRAGSATTSAVLSWASSAAAVGRWRSSLARQRSITGRISAGTPWVFGSLVTTR